MRGPGRSSKVSAARPKLGVGGLSRGPQRKLTGNGREPETAKYFALYGDTFAGYSNVVIRNSDCQERINCFQKWRTPLKKGTHILNTAAEYFELPWYLDGGSMWNRPKIIRPFMVTHCCSLYIFLCRRCRFSTNLFFPTLLLLFADHPRLIRAIDRNFLCFVTFFFVLFPIRRQIGFCSQ